MPVPEGDLYTPRFGNIGFDVNFDQVPFTLETYKRIVDYLAKKKSRSRSPFLLIWSLDFWRDKHTIGGRVIEYIKRAFASSHFDRVYFVESLDGGPAFKANLTVNQIKG